MMKRHSVYQSIRILLLIFISSGLAQAQRETRKNILWIFVEDLSPWMASYGYETNAGKTPTLDRLAANGVRFARAYVPAPVCSACRSAMITGVYQTTTGTHNHRSSRTKESAIYLPKGIKTIPEIFREHGYATFNKGKDDYNFIYDRNALYSVGNPNKKHKGFYGKQGRGDWKSVAKGKPWFGQIQLYGGKARTNKLADKVDPSKMKVPPYFPDADIFRKEWAHHYNTVRVTDNDVARIMKRLRDDGLLENTVVFFFSDHGNNHSLRHKQFCYEGGVHVPLIICGPGIPKNKVRTELMSTLDICATSLALAGIPLPDYLDGQDLFSPDYQKAGFVISARDRCDYTIDRIRTVRTEKYRYIRNFLTDRILLQPQYRDGKAPTQYLRKLHAEGKLGQLPEQAFFSKRPAEELYDLSKDPHQVNNLATDPNYADELKKHRKILTDWIKRTDDKGQYPESEAGLRAVLKRWGKKCVNPEYKALRETQTHKENTRVKKLTIADYEARKLRDWTVYVENLLIGDARLNKAVGLLDTKLAEVERLINPAILPKLKSVPIWLNKNVRHGACYHPNPKWLEANDRMPEKVRSIELQNIDHFIDWSKQQPMMILHELAHAYHHQEFGFKHAVITKAFQKAKASKTYDKVTHVSGKQKVHYAMSNEKEYFAECTEAYFGKNDFYPFTRSDLKKHDPAGYSMVETLWKTTATGSN